ncbi:hypothetical protein VB773_08240 [Haloarculaceae archaeon H-GB2-1]|nr:hypothetical protein [Haloarculaceae archaeon H-GB1-1]MEA5386047.1 hypothetical protein [Haloarculaceae archaeon H-GB11]MEA5407554.1 hypothetical protein [Haloarculaceae archaeon H-GB2-1]
MSLRINAALKQGFSRTFETNGLLLVGVFVVFGLLDAVVSQTLLAGMSQQLGGAGAFGPGSAPAGFQQGQMSPFGGQQSPLALDGIPFAVAGALSLLFGLVAEGLRIVSIRVFASDNVQSIPGSLAKRNILLAVLNGVVAGIIVGIAVAVGVVLLVFPGIFLALSFFFVRQEIAVEDKNFADALSGSWALSKGNRIELFGLALIIWIIGIIASSPNIVLFFLSPDVAAIVGQVINGFVVVFGIATATRAYEQLRSERSAGIDDAVGSTEFDDSL